MEEGQKEREEFSIASSAFVHGGSIPIEYTCDGDRFKAPPLVVSSAPKGTQSVAIIMEDPDVPKEVLASGLFVHWVVFDIPCVECTTLTLEGEVPGVVGANTRGEARYTGPCPPTEYQPNEHRYYFYAYALDAVLGLPEGATKEEVLAAMEGHVLAEAQTLARYKKQQQ